MAFRLKRVARCAVIFAAVAVLAGCAAWQPTLEQAPGSPQRTDARERPLPAPPIYEVRRGDTLYSIAFRYGLDWRDVSSWNKIEAPYMIRPGQELRLSPPPPGRPALAVPAESEPPPRESAADSSSADPPATIEPPQTSLAETQAPPDPGVGRVVSGLRWQWPTTGVVLEGYDPAATRRGIAIGGREGQSVVAAAKGEIVYSGTGLIGYGELIIVKHSETMLSAYGHNRRRLVEEGDRVGAGQTIAEMGRNERDEVVLHFEIRRDGQPVDPLGFLPEAP